MVEHELKDLINKSGRSLKWISKELNVKYGTLNAYMNGYRNLPIKLKELILEIIK